MGRAINDLDPKLKPLCHKHISACKDAGLELLVYCTKRTEKEQAIEYLKGRAFSILPKEVFGLMEEDILMWMKMGYTQMPGAENKSIVTHVFGNNSPHVRGVAYDCVPLVKGKAEWNNLHLWETVGEIGETLGLEWGGRWKMRDYPHFQLK